jgi:hypothetical protein
MKMKEIGKRYDGTSNPGKQLPTLLGRGNGNGNGEILVAGRKPRTVRTHSSASAFHFLHRQYTTYCVKTDAGISSTVNV